MNKLKKKAPEISQTNDVQRQWEKDIKEEIADIKTRLESIPQWPTANELAHLSVAMKRADVNSDPQQLVDDAWWVWVRSRERLRLELKETIEYNEMKLGVGIADWYGVGEDLVDFVDGKADFEVALKALMGETTRKADRYRIFREFMRDQVRKNSGNKDEAKIAAAAEKRFAELKMGGFPEDSFHKAKAWFVEWRKDRRRERAKKAAKERWKVGEAKGDSGDVRPASERKQP